MVLADLTPIVDTLWTLKTTQTPWVEFQACAIGGSPRGFVVATIRRAVPQLRFLVEYDIITGEERRSVLSNHGADVNHLTFARNANVLATAEPGLIKVWRWPELELITTIATSEGMTHYTRSTALLNSTGTQVFDARSGVMYDVATGDTVWSWKRTCVNAMPKLTRDDRYLLVHDCDVDKPYQDLGVLIDAATGKPIIAFSGGAGEAHISVMAVSDDGRFVAIVRRPDLSPSTVGSLMVYDRSEERIALQLRLDGMPGLDGYDVHFTPEVTGIFVARAPNGIPDSIGVPRGFYEFYPAWSTQGISRHAWFGRGFSFDWEFNYLYGIGRVAVSHLDLGTVSVNEVAQSGTSTVFPNPSEGVVRVTAANVADNVPVTYEIVAVNGQVVSAGSTTFTDGLCTIRLNPYPSPGSYSVRILSGAKILVSASLILK